jgi:predicted DNA-binding protein
MMPTEKKRIHITVDDETFEALGRLSEKRGESLAGVGLSLIEQALEYQEDLHFSRIADDRLKSRQRRISHSKAWA